MKSNTSQTEIRFTVDKEFLEKLEKRLGVNRSTDVARSALALLDWASAQTEGGRVILSSTESGEKVQRLAMPELSRMKTGA